MPDLRDGESVEMRGSAVRPYVLTNTGGVYSCTCPAWRNQSLPIERRTCKHLRSLRGDASEAARTGGATPVQAKRPAAKKAASTPSTAPEPESEAAEAVEGAPPLLLAHSWDGGTDLTGWWMSEKLDGVRAYWDGQRFISRLGNAYHAPEWFVRDLPNVPLDGELWGGRRCFQRTVSIVRRQDQSDLWKEISFVVFDAPALVAPFEDRLAFCRDQLTLARLPYASYHPHQVCRGTEHLGEELRRVEALGGEGLMLRRPGSRYEAGRSHTLLKVKSFHDAEARIVEHLPGAGRHKGRLGALLLELPDGTRFAAGTGLSDEDRRQPPPLGAVVTFRYQELSNRGVPRFPSYVGVRHDFIWPGEAVKDPKKTTK